MARTSRTPKLYGRPAVSLPHLYVMWRKERRVLGLSCSPRFSDKVWKELFRTQGIEYRGRHQGLRRSGVRRREALKLPDSTGPSEHPDEDDGSADNVGSSNATPDEDIFGSPLSESASSDLLGEPSSSTGPSTPGQLTITRPSPVLHAFHPHLPPNESYDLGPFSAVHDPFPIEEYQIPCPPTVPLHSPIPSYPLSGIHHIQDPDIVRGEEVYRLLSAPEQVGCWDPNLQAASLAVPPATLQLGPSTSIPSTSATACDSLGFVAPWYTPGVNTQGLPAKPDDDWFAFNSVEPLAPDQPFWDAGLNFEHTYFPQQTLTSQTLVAPPPLLPPVPAAMDGSNTNSVEAQWRSIAQILESDPPQATAPPPAYRQTTPLVTGQQALDVLDLSQRGHDAKTLQQRLMMIERVTLTFAPPQT